LIIPNKYSTYFIDYQLVTVCLGKGVSVRLCADSMRLSNWLSPKWLCIYASCSCLFLIHHIFK